MHVLRIFEAAGRHLNFKRTAKELGTHQPAVSRYIAELEYELGVQLFERGHRSLSLTPAGEIYHRNISLGLDRIAKCRLTAKNVAEDRQVVIASNHAISHLFLMPRYKTLRQELGENISVCIRVTDKDTLVHLDRNEIDLVISYDENTEMLETRVELFKEAVSPVCSTEFWLNHANLLTQSITKWGSLPFLRLSDKHNWACWHDWFEFAGFPSPRPKFISIHDYVYLLQAAIDGQGIALGCKHYIDHYVNNKLLVMLSDRLLEFDRYCFACLTKRGIKRKVAHRCLEILANLKNDSSLNLLSQHL